MYQWKENHKRTCTALEIWPLSIQVYPRSYFVETMIHWPGCCITVRLFFIKPTLDVVEVQGEKVGSGGLQHILETLRIDPQLVLAIAEAVTADLHNTTSPMLLPRMFVPVAVIDLWPRFFTVWINVPSAALPRSWPRTPAQYFRSAAHCISIDKTNWIRAFNRTQAPPLRFQLTRPSIPRILSKLLEGTLVWMRVTWFGGRS